MNYVSQSHKLPSFNWSIKNSFFVWFGSTREDIVEACKEDHQRVMIDPMLLIVNRPGVAGTVLKSALLLIH